MKDYIELSVQAFAMPDGTEEVIGRNTNTEPTAKVKAFVMSFHPAALWVSEQCHGLPEKFILAHWGAESGWGSTAESQKAQNWASICVPGGYENQFRRFAGRREFAQQYARLLMQGSHYGALRSYLASTEQPDVRRCISLIASSGYAAASPAAYEKLLRDCVASIEKRVGAPFI